MITETPLRSEQARDWRRRYPAMSAREIARRTGLTLHGVQCALRAQSSAKGRPKSPPKTRLTLSLPTDLVANLREHCANTDVTVTSVVQDAVQRALGTSSHTASRVPRKSTARRGEKP